MKTYKRAGCQSFCIIMKNTIRMLYNNMSKQFKPVYNRHIPGFTVPESGSFIIRAGRFV
jgi:hypothetical protein